MGISVLAPDLGEPIKSLVETAIMVIKFTNMAQEHGTRSIEAQKLAELQAEVYRVFSHAKRIQIFWLLMETETPVNEIADTLGSSVQNTSQHLRLMKALNILDTRRSGQTIFYRIAETDIGNYCRRILEKNLAEFKLSVL